MIQIYTGDGKGKTTAALGLALRAAGHGMKAVMIQFMKGKINYGELKAVKRFKNFSIEQYGRPDFVDRDKPALIDRELAQKGMQRARAIIKAGKHDIVILDEINVAVEFGLIAASEVIELMKKIPEKMELVLTGRYMPPEFVDHAHLVSEVREVKHYFHKKCKARKGIEY